MSIDQILNPPPAPTPRQLKAALTTMVAVTETIREAKQIPDGHLYAGLMSRMDLATYNTMIDRIVGAGLVEKRDNMLRWVGPNF